VLGVSGHALDHRIRDVLVELGLAGAQHVRHTELAFRIVRITQPQLLRERHLRRIDVCDGKAHGGKRVLVHDLDRAPVGDVRHGQANDGRQGGLVLQGRGERLARMGQKSPRLLRPVVSAEIVHIAQKCRRAIGGHAADRQLDRELGAVRAHGGELDTRVERAALLRGEVP
jgi:hypothetical protein